MKITREMVAAGVEALCDDGVSSETCGSDLAETALAVFVAMLRAGGHALDGVDADAFQDDDDLPGAPA